MLTTQDAQTADSAELQNVLTRYVDSFDGYTQAAEVVGSQGLAAAFLEIAARRKSIVENVATLIVQQGGKPDIAGSPEAAIHRWWIRVKAGMTEEEFKATLVECVHGEKELARTVQNALDHGNLAVNHAAIVREVGAELKETIHTFESVIE